MRSCFTWRSVRWHAAVCGLLPWLPQLQECSVQTRGNICCPQKIERVTETQRAPSGEDVDGFTERMEGIESDHVEVLDAVDELSQRVDALEANAGSTKAEDSDDDDEDAEDEEEDDEGDAQVAELEVRFSRRSCCAPTTFAIGEMLVTELECRR